MLRLLNTEFELDSSRSIFLFFDSFHQNTPYCTDGGDSLRILAVSVSSHYATYLYSHSVRAGLS
jgi:hypothetical protein